MKISYTYEPQDIVAIRDSIEKWETNVGLKRYSAMSIGVDTCPLCKLYYNSNKCIGCPIAEESKSTCCEDTPYTERSINSSQHDIQSFSYFHTDRITSIFSSAIFVYVLLYIRTYLFTLLPGFVPNVPKLYVSWEHIWEHYKILSYMYLCLFLAMCFHVSKKN